MRHGLRRMLLLIAVAGLSAANLFAQQPPERSPTYASAAETAATYELPALPDLPAEPPGEDEQASDASASSPSDEVRQPEGYDDLNDGTPTFEPAERIASAPPAVIEAAPSPPRATTVPQSEFIEPVRPALLRRQTATHTQPTAASYEDARETFDYTIVGEKSFREPTQTPPTIAKSPLVDQIAESEQAELGPASTHEQDLAVAEHASPIPEIIDPRAFAAANSTDGAEDAAAQQAAEPPVETAPPRALDASDVAAFRDAEQRDVSPASFRGIQPRHSTTEELQYAWGEPTVVEGDEAAPVLIYHSPPFDRVEVASRGGLVQSIAVTFHNPLDPFAVEAQLQLGAFTPVVVRNADGEALGQVYPERGVFFTFSPLSDRNEVAQILLDGVQAEAFALRAETMPRRTYAQRLADLETAIRLDPSFSRSNWLKAGLLGELGRRREAAAAAEDALDAEPDHPEILLRYAETLIALRDDQAARTAVEAVLAADGLSPVVEATALKLTGDLHKLGSEPDFKEALAKHQLAIGLVDAGADAEGVELRRAAKRLLLDAHLAIADDVARGPWSNRAAATAKWLARAKTYADDLMEQEDAHAAVGFQTAVAAVTTAVALDGEFDPDLWLKSARRQAQEILASEEDPLRRQVVQRDLAVAFLDAASVAYSRRDADAVLAHGETAEQLLAGLHEGARPSNYEALLGRLYFRVGAAQAVLQQDHAAAVASYDKAIPHLSLDPLAAGEGDPTTAGEMWISMGVSYWRRDAKERALQLTERGVAIIEKGVADEVAPRDALSVPYQNLAAMHRKLGSEKDSQRFSGLAESVGGGILR